MNKQQELLNEIVEKTSQVGLAKKLKCKPQFISNIRRGVANLPVPMWKILIKAKLVNRLTVFEAIVEDYENKLFREMTK